MLETILALLIFSILISGFYSFSNSLNDKNIQISAIEKSLLSNASSENISSANKNFSFNLNKNYTVNERIYQDENVKLKYYLPVANTKTLEYKDFE